MSVTAADIQALPGGEFAAVAPSIIDKYIARAERRIHQATWGARYDDAVELLTAHMLLSAIAGGASAAGSVTSEGAGPFSRGYAGSARPSQYDSTSYGQQYAAMMRELGTMGFVA
jgi:hypothetical protein